VAFISDLPYVISYNKFVAICIKLCLNPEHFFTKALLYVAQMHITEMCVMKHEVRTYRTYAPSLTVFISAHHSFITILRIESSTIPIKYQLDCGFTTIVK